MFKDSGRFYARSIGHWILGGGRLCRALWLFSGVALRDPLRGQAGHRHAGCSGHRVFCHAHSCLDHHHQNVRHDPRFQNRCARSHFGSGFWRGSRLFALRGRHGVLQLARG